MVRGQENIKVLLLQGYPPGYLKRGTSRRVEITYMGLFYLVPQDDGSNGEVW
jgi:hypothetical protein